MNNLSKITKLLSNGGKIIVADEKIDPKFIIINIDEYERITNGEQDNLTEENILSKINYDIAIWKNAQQADNISAESNNLIRNIWKNKSEENDDEYDEYYFESVDDKN